MGIGIKARKIADGKWVNTIVLIRPIRLDIDDATRLDIAPTMLVVKNRVPSWPSGRENFLLKKYVIQDWGTRPLAKESTAKRRQSLRRILREDGEMFGQMDFDVLTLDDL